MIQILESKGMANSIFLNVEAYASLPILRNLAAMKMGQTIMR